MRVAFLCIGGAPSRNFEILAESLAVAGHRCLLLSKDKHKHSGSINIPSPLKRRDKTGKQFRELRGIAAKNRRQVALQLRLWLCFALWRISSGRMIEAMHVALAVTVMELDAIQMLKNAKPDVLVISDHRNVNYAAGFQNAAERLGIPIVEIQYAVSRWEGALHMKRGDERNHFSAATGMWRLLYALRPEQRFKEVVYNRPAQALGLFICGALSPNPWAIGGRKCAATLVLNHEEVERAATFGADTSKLVPVGDIPMDAIHAAKRRANDVQTRVAKEYFGGNDGKICVYAVPHFAEHSLAEWEPHLRFFEQSLDVLNNSGLRTVLSLHPAADRGRYAEIVDRFPNAVIVDEPLSKIIAGADVFLAAHSSTLRWAYALDIPTVVVDPFDFGFAFSMFRGGEKMCIVKNGNELRRGLQAAVGGHRGAVPEFALDDRQFFDGRVLDRIVEQIERFAPRRAKAAVKQAQPAE